MSLYAPLPIRPPPSPLSFDMSYGQQRDCPIIKPAQSPTQDPAHSAAIIFLHGLDDDAHGWEDIANQFQRANKLPYLQWIFPNAPHNHDARQNAWYNPTPLRATPAGRPELAEEEDEEGLRKSVAYVESLVDGLCSKGIPTNRIVLAGFSQGCALSLLTELTSRHSGRFAGIAGLMGYLPLPDKIQAMRSEAGLPHVVGEVPLFLGRGGQDRLIPHTRWDETVGKLKELGFGSALELKEYPDLGHALSPVVLQDLLVWLESIVPKLED
ncbi:hypothetical protein AAFC00_004158 [Neodothiora populina]|uniref:Acyl-protein thioesterase 1 n=1 Tax=Neodothiora populina TaxID=2781224 RepID=A0ABR3PIR9_9PEZI